MDISLKNRWKKVSLRIKILGAVGIVVLLGIALNAFAALKIQQNEQTQAARKHAGMTYRESLNSSKKTMLSALSYMNQYRLTADKNEWIKAQETIKSLEQELAGMPHLEGSSDWSEMKKSLQEGQKRLTEKIDLLGNAYRRAKQSRLATNALSDQITSALHGFSKELERSGAKTEGLRDSMYLLHEAATASLKLQADSSDPQLDKILPRLSSVDTGIQAIRATKLTDPQREIIDEVNELFKEYRSELSQVSLTTKAYAASVEALDQEGTVFGTAVDQGLQIRAISSEPIATDFWSQPLIIVTTTSVAFTILGIWVGFQITNSMTPPLERAVQTMSDAMKGTSQSAQGVAQSSVSVANGSSKQASSIEESSASLEEISSMTKRNTELVGMASALARETRLSAETGTSEMGTMIAAMKEIEKANFEVEKIIKSIDEIAFQTNILALNAAVEAARAGEHGLGFSVVAEEVRRLALRSAEASRETSQKIEGSIVKTKSGSKVIDTIGKRLNEIVKKVREVDNLVAEVTKGSQEQERGISQINLAIVEIEKITQNNASASSQTASASQELTSQAAKMWEVVEELKEFIHGGVTLISITKVSSEPIQAIPAKQFAPKKTLPRNGHSKPHQHRSTPPRTLCSSR